ncbi:hypothetical protein AbraIFM66951_003460 [Aspergillus brasiliensis]|uniref:Uncharacterized protein n=1 Tax=Aspergillus brasiliensis TaxID=319629 RepID=A0A9W5YKZ1_9EURO|nr:hypothetical protein AbraCBS73388_001505 [Aspergillus brasiliensis]GKZ43095.1 hypothetical protein AbraIFM66951_003460 [Aspergillus brasiliensis]
MVNWKQPESADRLFAALIVAHPSLKLDYQAMARYFGQEATYDAIQNRLRRCHALAEQLRQEAIERGIADVPLAKGRKSSTAITSSPTPRTPRVGRNGIQKPPSSSSRRKSTPKTTAIKTPTRNGAGSSRAGTSIMDAISLEDDVLVDENTDVKPTVKVESRPAHISTMTAAPDGSDVEVIEMAPSPPPLATSKAEIFYDSVSTFPSYGSVGISNGSGPKVKREREHSRFLSSNEAPDTETNPTPSRPTSHIFSRSSATFGLSTIGGFPQSSSSGYDMDDLYAEVA